MKAKAAAETHIRGILSRYANFTLTERIIGDDLAFVEALLRLHPRANDIVDCGVKEFRVQRVPFNETQRRFLVIRKDGSWHDFAWRRCLSPRSQLQHVRNICREIVRPQIAEFCDRFWAAHPHDTVCPILNVPMSPANAHVDHAPPTFTELVARWLEVNQQDAEDIEIEFRKGYEESSTFVDSGLAESWSEFHALNCRLRVVSKLANLSTLRRRAAA